MGSGKFMAPRKEREADLLTMFNDLLCVNATQMPIGYARVHAERITELLANDAVPTNIRRQLGAVLDAIRNPALKECAGLDRLHWFLDECKKRYT